MGRLLSLLLLSGCSSAYASSPPPTMVTETIWTGIKDRQATGTTTGLYAVCYENADCPSLCCVGRPICVTCRPFGDAAGDGNGVCVPAALCQGG
jgi:hypothetical protein